MSIPESNMTPTPPVLRRDSTLAIISLVSGLLGWTLLPVIGAITAVVTGHLARKEIRESNNTLSGDGMALAGLILGYVEIGIGVLVLLCALTLFPVLRQSGGF